MVTGIEIEPLFLPTYYYNIIEASFSSENGWAIISLEGSKEELDRLFLYLREKEIEVRDR